MATLAFVSGGILVLIGLLVFIAWPWLRSPNLLLWTWIYQWITLFTYANAMREVVVPAIWEITRSNASGGLGVWFWLAQ